VKDLVANHLGKDRNGLYMNAGGFKNVVESLQDVLNTTVNSPGIASALVKALGAQKAGKDKASSWLVIDEVNFANDANESFIQSLFLAVAEEGNLICIVVSSKATAADNLLQLNGGKIRPFPGFARANWDAYQNQSTGWIDVSWTVPQLRALLVFRFGNAAKRGEICYNFLFDGMTPGRAVSHVKSELATREHDVLPSI
jgi:hypothetical protein